MRISYYFRNYPFSLCIIVAVFYLSFFTPPQTELNEINHFDKFAHIAMYGGLSLVIWVEELRCRSQFNLRKAAVRVALFPFLMSGGIELLQAYCTENRSGDWLDLAANSCGIIIAFIMGYTALRPLMCRNK